MSVSTTASRKFREYVASAQINFGTLGTGLGNPHSFKMILMNNSFTFDVVNHAYYSDIASSELVTGNGYYRGSNVNGKVIGALTLSFSESNSLIISYPQTSWVSSGTIGPSSGALIYDYSSDDVIVCYINFGTTQMAYNGGTFLIAQGTIVLP